MKAADSLHYKIEESNTAYNYIIYLGWAAWNSLEMSMTDSWQTWQKVWGRRQTGLNLIWAGSGTPRQTNSDLSVSLVFFFLCSDLIAILLYSDVNFFLLSYVNFWSRHWNWNHYIAISLNIINSTYEYKDFLHK